MSSQAATTRDAAVFLAGLVAAFVLSGCTPLFSSKTMSKTSPDIGKYQVKTIVIMPFGELATPQQALGRREELSVPGGIKRSDITIAIPPSGSGDQPDQPKVGIPPYAAEKVAQLFYGKLKSWEGIRVSAPEDVTRTIKALGSEVVGLTPEQMARKVTAKLSVDAAVLGRVLVYRERVGSKLGADPAEVGFEVKLVSADGTTLWHGNYYEKQKPLTEDAKGFFERKGVFVTAEELAEYGAEHLVQEFPFGARSIRRP